MKEYIFKTIVTMKEYNRENWWIDSDVVKEIRIDAENIKAALNEYREIVTDKYYIDVSKNALKTKRKMFVDIEGGGAKQIGFVITGSTDFENNYKWVKQFVDLWIEILTVETPDFLEV